MAKPDMGTAQVENLKIDVVRKAVEIWAYLKKEAKLKGNKCREFAGERAVGSPAAAKALFHSGTSYLGQAWVAKQESRDEASGSVLLNGMASHAFSVPFVPLHWWVQRCLLRVDSGDMVSCNCRCVAKEGQPANSKDDYSKWCSSFFSHFTISLHPSLSVPETVSLSGMCHSKTTMPHSEAFGVQLKCVFSFAPNLLYGDQLVYVKCLLKVKLGA